MAVNSSDLDKQTYGRGYRVERTDLNEIQENSRGAVRRIRQTLSGWGSVGTPATVAAQSPASLSIDVGPGEYIDGQGRGFRNDSSFAQSLDQATHGSILGSTAPTTSGTVRYVVFAGIYEEVESDQRTDTNGQTYNHRQEGGFQEQVWQTANITAPDVLEDNAVLAALLNTIIATGAVPIAVGVRAFGATTISTVWNVTRRIFEEGDPVADRDNIRDMLAFSELPVVANASGTIAATGTAVPGQGGSVTIPGGERIHITWQDHADGDKLKRISVTLPATTVAVNATSTSHMIRMYVDRDRNAVIYRGLGTYQADPDFGLLSRGTDGGTAQGSRATLIDIPLLQVHTGASGTTPDVEQIQNSPRPVDTGDTPSVTEFGAVGDGTNNDLAAFNAALAASNVVRVPWTEKGYRLEGTLDLSGKQLLGEGNVVLRFILPNVTTDAIVVGFTGRVNETLCVIHNFTITSSSAYPLNPGDSVDPAVIGAGITGRDLIRVKGSSHMTITNVRLDYANRDGLRFEPDGTDSESIDFTENFYARQLEVFHAKQYGISMLTSANTSTGDDVFFNEMVFETCEIRQCGVAEFYYDASGTLADASVKSEGVSWIGCNFNVGNLTWIPSPLARNTTGSWVFRRTGVLVQGAVARWVLDNCTWEDTGSFATNAIQDPINAASGIVSSLDVIFPAVPTGFNPANNNRLSPGHEPTFDGSIGNQITMLNGRIVASNAAIVNGRVTVGRLQTFGANEDRFLVRGSGVYSAVSGAPAPSIGLVNDEGGTYSLRPLDNAANPRWNSGCGTGESFSWQVGSTRLLNLFGTTVEIPTSVNSFVNGAANTFFDGSLFRLNDCLMHWRKASLSNWRAGYDTGVGVRTWHFWQNTDGNEGTNTYDPVISIPLGLGATSNISISRDINVGDIVQDLSFANSSRTQGRGRGNTLLTSEGPHTRDLVTLPTNTSLGGERRVLVVVYLAGTQDSGGSNGAAYRVEGWAQMASDSIVTIGTPSQADQIGAGTGAPSTLPAITFDGPNRIVRISITSKNSENWNWSWSWEVHILP